MAPLTPHPDRLCLIGLKLSSPHDVSFVVAINAQQPPFHVNILFKSMMIHQVNGFRDRTLYPGRVIAPVIVMLKQAGIIRPDPGPVVAVKALVSGDRGGERVPDRVPAFPHEALIAAAIKAVICIVNVAGCAPHPPVKAFRLRRPSA
jgi:hypothetical protein